MKKNLEFAERLTTGGWHDLVWLDCSCRILLLLCVGRFMDLIDYRYFKRDEPTLPSGEYYQPWECAQWVRDYWWGNCEPIDNEY